MRIFPELNIQMKSGVTRDVLLIGRYAFKFPSFQSWRQFLMGLIANQHEKMWAKSDKRLCPIHTYVPGGFLNVMLRAEPIKEGYGEEIDKMKADLLPVERKYSSFGLLNGQLVAVDYG